MEKKIAKDLLSIGAVFLRPEQPFTWASGIKSPIYCDNRLTLTAPVVRGHVEAGLAEIVRTKFPEAEVLMGTSTAGIAHAAITATILDLPMGYVRSGAKDHGRKNQIEGKGFSLVEVISTCPTNWGMTPQKALDWAEENMIPYYPLGVYKDIYAKEEEK